MTILMRRLHCFEHTVDAYIYHILCKNTIVSYFLLFISIPLVSLILLLCVALLALPVVYLFM